MISVRLDNNGAYRVRWPSPSRELEIIHLGVAYVAYESGLPAVEQLTAPSLALMVSTLAAAQAQQATAGTGEASRAIAAETYRQALSAARPKLNLALLHLKAKYAANQAQLEGWGLDTVVGATGISVRKPRTELEWMHFLARYVAQETSLDAANRLTEPTLAEMTALNTALQNAAAARRTGRNQREAAVQTRTAITNRLLDLLQGAAMVIVLTQFEGVVTNALQQWGFEVVARPSKMGSISED